MSDVAQLPRFSETDLPERMTLAEVETSRHTMEELQRHKREGLELAVRARWVALFCIALLVAFLVQTFDAIYYYVFILALALNGWALRHVGRVGRSGAELALIFVDVALMVSVLTMPPPLAFREIWPSAMTYRFDNFMYLYVLLALGTLSYNWKTIAAIGHWTVVLWLVGVLCIWLFGYVEPALTEAVTGALPAAPILQEILDPNSLATDVRIQEVAVFLIVTYTLAASIRRFDRLLLRNASLTRERTNLSRYFSPNVVEALSKNDEPLREVREEVVTVMFVDLIGFTGYAAARPAREVIDTLRQFHARMEACVFAHGGTLDKYLGDGLMATFGTPFAGADDAARAYACSLDMLRAVDVVNAERRAAGVPELQVSVGLHTGPVVLGDIGANRLEFAVIGNTVNVASRMEGLTRNLKARLVLSEEAKAAAAADGADTSALSSADGQIIRGLEGTVTVWTMSAPEIDNT